MKLVTALLVGLLVIATFAPLVVAEPHIEQTPAILAFAHAMQRLAPALSIVVAALLVIRLWRDKSWRAWTLLLGVTVACVWLSRVNLLEWIFAGASDTHFANIDDFHDVRDTRHGDRRDDRWPRAALTRSAIWPTITCSTTALGTPNCCRPIERFATPVWCGTV